MVFCHGTPWSAALWASYADALAADHTVYLWDMPGYGQSSKHPEHAVDLTLQGEAFVALLGLWKLDAPRVIAHDYGGAVALRAHLLHGATFESLCLVDVVALSPWGSPFFTLVKQHPGVFEQFPAAIHRGVVEAYIDGASRGGLRPEELRLLAGPWLDEAGQSAFYRQISQADERHTDEIEPLLSAVRAPTHIIWGAADTWIPVDRAERLKEAIPGSTVTLIPEAGHLIQFDATAELAAELVRWVSS